MEPLDLPINDESVDAGPDPATVHDEDAEPLDVAITKET